MIILAFAVFLAAVALLGWLLPRFVGKLATSVWERRLARRQRRLDQGLLGEVMLADESGAALPFAIGVLTVVAFGYLAFVAVRQVLRVAGALP